MLTRLNFGPLFSNKQMINLLIAGTPLELLHHNVARKGERDGLKSREIGQSAAKLLGWCFRASTSGQVGSRKRVTRDSCQVRFLA